MDPIAATRALIRTVVGNHLFSERAVDVAVLHPMGRGIMPDRHLGTAICTPHTTR